MTLMLLGLSSLINGWLVGSVEENVGKSTPDGRRCGLPLTYEEVEGKATLEEFSV